MPRKTAGVSKLGVDRSLIDKGDNDYEETQHSDGKVHNPNKQSGFSYSYQFNWLNSILNL